MEYFNQWALYEYIGKLINRDYSHVIYVFRHFFGKKYAKFEKKDLNLAKKTAL